MTPDEISTNLVKRAADLKKLRREKKVSKIALFKATGISRKTIDAMESGSRGWSVTSEILYTTYLNTLPSKPTK